MCVKSQYNNNCSINNQCPFVQRSPLFFFTNHNFKIYTKEVYKATAHWETKVSVLLNCPNSRFTFYFVLKNIKKLPNDLISDK